MDKVLTISTNIERDSSKELDYIVTSNVNEVYNRLIYNYTSGQHAFNIIGSYGTGKSSFLWAFEQHLNGKTKFGTPVNGEFKGVEKFEFVRFIGESKSFRATFAQFLNISDDTKKTNKELLDALGKHYLGLEKKKKALIILVDEFGKYLEYANKYNPDEIYFIQELAEYCSDSNKQIMLVTTLHQNFAAYSKGLSKEQRNEWEKVKGRLLDLPFDEPVEQLLFFAAKRLEKVKVKDKKRLDKLIKAVLHSGLIGKVEEGVKSIFDDLYPLDPLAANILTRSLQRYGQNERSLFTFLNSTDLNEFIDNKEIFTTASCFDYLIEHHHNEINDGEKNPFKPQWKAGLMALEKAEHIFDEDYQQASKLIKTICLANIFGKQYGAVNDEFILRYGIYGLGINNPDLILNKLIEQKVVGFSKHRNKYNFLDGTDVDIEQELINAASQVEQDFNVVALLQEYFDFSVIPAKRVQYEKGTPRFFEFKFWDEYNCEEPLGEIDGYINLIFSSKRILSTIKSKSKEEESAQLFVLYKEVEKIKEVLFELGKINYVISKHKQDQAAIRILNEEKLFRQEQLEKLVLEALYASESDVTWVFKGHEKKVTSQKKLNQLLSEVSEEIYPGTPVFKNELANKEFLSTPILTARKSLIRKLISSGDIEDLGFDKTKFPPEKSIYLTLLKVSKIHQKTKQGWIFNAPEEEGLLRVWNCCEDFLNESRNGKKNIGELYDKLKQRPYKLKQGFVDFWIPIFLIIKKEDYALYFNNGGYIPQLDTDVMDLIHKKPSNYSIKGLNVEGVRLNLFNHYKELVGFDESNIKGVESTFITIYSNFLRFYRGLPQYVKETKNLSAQALGIREAIAKAKDPESALFEKIPFAMGYSKIESLNEKDFNQFITKVNDGIDELKVAYDQLLERIEVGIVKGAKINATEFVDYKPQLIKKYKAVNQNRLNEKLKTFYKRVVSSIDDRSSYLKSVCDYVLGRPLETIKDEEEGWLIDNIQENLNTLLDVVDIHAYQKEDNEELVQIKLLDESGDDSFKKSILISAKQKKEAIKIEKDLTILLKENSSSLNKIALLNLLKKELKKK